MQGNGGEWRKHRVLIGNVVGNALDEPIGHRNDLSVRSIGNDAVAKGEVRPRRGRHDPTDIAIAHGDGLRQLAPDGLDSGQKAFGSNLLPNLANALGLLASLLEPASAAKLYQHALRAERH